MGNTLFDIGRRKSFRLPYPCNSQTSCYPYETILQRGKYYIETWGAQGGDSNSYKGGKGAYACGILTILNPVKAFIYIGAKGTSASGIKNKAPAAFNGGGSGFTGGPSGTFAASGGGGTDIRIGLDDVKRRVIVAAGGGGTGYFSHERIGGAGGNETGLDAVKYSEGTSGKGANQFSKCPKVSNSDESDLGQGSNKLNIDGCGGGGGFFGGGAGAGFLSGGGGGSSFVYTKETSTNPNVNLEKKYILRNAFLVSGANSFPSFSSFANETGHEGNGCAIITKMDLSYCTCNMKNNMNLIVEMIFLSVSQ